DQDATLSIVAALETPVAENPGALRFVKQTWISGAIDYNERVVELTSKLSPNNLDYDTVLAEACQGILAVGELNELLAPRSTKISVVAKREADRLKAIPRTVTPIVLSHTPDRAFADLLAADSTARFDLDGDGLTERWP